MFIQKVIYFSRRAFALSVLPFHDGGICPRLEKLGRNQFDPIRHSKMFPDGFPNRSR
jgi:hypothetical protein